MIRIKELSKEDILLYTDSLFDTYSALVKSTGGDIHELLSIFQKMNEQGTVVLVAFDGEKKEIVGVISLLVEHKLIRGGVLAGHIEDVAVNKNAQGQGIGKKLIDQALVVAKEKGCYKVILDCDTPLSGYYENFGFENNGTFMRKYI